ncbi:MAG: pitrilysin family protein [Planctomycetota bacterium]|nr:pitrilysin family protein [Planctomycetota bacterium]
MRLLAGSVVSILMLASSLACTGQPPSAPAPDMPIAARAVTDDGSTLVTLENGMTVIIKPMRTSPVVTVRGYVHTGGMYEGPLLGAGVSHLLEHLVAKGAQHEGQVTAGHKVDRVEEIGGQSNAYTSMEHTCYYISATAGKTPACIDLIADWLARPEITEDDFRREHGVVQRELELGEDKVGTVIWQLHAQGLYGPHPAAVPVIGYLKPLSELTRADVLAYHARAYVPQNMVFVIVGDVDVEASLARCRKAFAGFARGRSPDLALPEVKPLAGIVRTVQPMPNVKDTVNRVSFQTIDLFSADLHALDLLSDVLTNGESSRLVNSLKNQKRLVTSIMSSSWTPSWGKGSLTFAFRAPVARAEAAEAALMDELRRVAAEGITGEELARAKKQKIAEHVYSQQTVESVGESLADDFLGTGDVAFSRNYVTKIQAVTAEQVQAAAKKYLTFDRLVATRLTPPSPATASGPASRPAEAAERTVVFETPDGTRVVLHPSKAVGLVAMTYAVQGGLLAEEAKTNGLGTAMAQLSLRGAGGRTADQIAAFFDSAGGDISAECGANTFYWQATVLKDSFAPALDILADVIQRPTFPAGELDALRPPLLAAAERVDEDSYAQLNRFFRGTFFPGKPYGLLPVGTPAVLKGVTIEQIREHHRQNVLGRPAVLAVYGNFDADAAAATLRAAFGGAKRERVSIPAGQARTVAAQGELRTLKTDKDQAGVVVGVPGMRVADRQDCLAINVLDTIISGYHMPGGWLHTELRGKQLVYVVHAQNVPGLQPGAFVVYAACQPEKVPEVLAVIRANLARAAGYTPTQQEVDRAVNTILTADLLGSQAMAELSMQAAIDELYGLGWDYRRSLAQAYRGVTPAEVLRVAKKYLTSGQVTCVATPKPAVVDKAAR